MCSREQFVNGILKRMDSNAAFIVSAAASLLIFRRTHYRLYPCVPMAVSHSPDASLPQWLSGNRDH
jgi:hypothetical protein